VGTKNPFFLIIVRGGLHNENTREFHERRGKKVSWAQAVLQPIAPEALPHFREETCPVQGREEAILLHAEPMQGLLELAT
jgi:hypothetical protein